MSKQQKVIDLPEREVDVETYLQRQCAKRKWECQKIDPKNHRGTFDRQIRPGMGMTLYVELKRKKGPIRPQQSKRLKELSERGYMAFIIEGKSEVNSLINWIERYQNEIRS